MFDIAMTLLEQLCKLIPFLFGIWVLFDLIGGLLFGKS